MYSYRMARPSKNIDQLLLAAGRELLPMSGCAGLSVRQLVAHAGVNLGMFHYHFKTKDLFIRAVLQQVYEEMFSELTLHTGDHDAALDNLREALVVLARFGRMHRRLLVRILADAMSGEPLSLQFLGANLPRHVGVVGKLVRQAQRQGALVNTPAPQLVAFLAGAVAAPILFGGALQNQLPVGAATTLVERHVLSDRAVARRIDQALRGVEVERQSNV